MDTKVGVEEIAMLLGQKEIELMVLRKEIAALREELRKAKDKPEAPQ